jgi:hypothetical protein
MFSRVRFAEGGSGATDRAYLLRGNGAVAQLPRRTRRGRGRHIARPSSMGSSAAFLLPPRCIAPVPEPCASTIAREGR